MLVLQRITLKKVAMSKGAITGFLALNMLMLLLWAGSRDNKYNYQPEWDWYAEVDTLDYPSSRGLVIGGVYVCRSIQMGCTKKGSCDDTVIVLNQTSNDVFIQFHVDKSTLLIGKADFFEKAPMLIGKIKRKP